MLRSMYSGISGLRTHQTMMDVVGNNIANVNTAGYKSSSTVFQDVLSQTLQGAGAPVNGAGGTNPAQVGLGVKLGAISTNFAQGASQLTGRATDLAIQGDGFFAVQQGGENLYTRSGSFNFDANGSLVTPSGASVLGWKANAGAINPNGPLEPVRLPIGQTLPPVQTGTVRLGGNIPDTEYDAAATDPVSITNGVTIFDSQGAPIKLSITYTQTGNDTWSVEATAPNANGSTPDAVVGTGTLTWDAATGKFNEPSMTLAAAGMAGVGNFTKDVTVQFGTPDEPMTQYAGSNSVAALEQDGAAIGALQSFTISPNGTVMGIFSNGMQEAIAQIAMANFANPGGLEKVGGSMYRPSPNSGLVQTGVAGEGGRGTLSGGTVEMSNVDLAQEFTNLIVAQRGFQANSRVISSSDELLQDLVNLKR
ncbi:MAG: flagellar basal-body rod protein FlgF [Mycobacteriales bacterium]